MSKACHWNCSVFTQWGIDCSIPCWPQRETLKLRDVLKEFIERKTSLWASTLKQYLLLLLYCFVCIFCCLGDFCVVECSLFYWKWWSRVVACINTRGHPKGTQLLLSHVFTSFFFVFNPSDKKWIMQMVLRLVYLAFWYWWFFIYSGTLNDCVTCLKCTARIQQYSLPWQLHMILSYTFFSFILSKIAHSAITFVSTEPQTLHVLECWRLLKLQSIVVSA